MDVFIDKRRAMSKAIVLRLSMKTGAIRDGRPQGCGGWQTSSAFDGKAQTALRYAPFRQRPNLSVMHSQCGSRGFSVRHYIRVCSKVVAKPHYRQKTFFAVFPLLLNVEICLHPRSAKDTTIFLYCSRMLSASFLKGMQEGETFL